MKHERSAGMYETPCAEKRLQVRPMHRVPALSGMKNYENQTR